MIDESVGTEIDAIDESVGNLTSSLSSQTTALTEADSGINATVQTTNDILANGFVQLMVAIEGAR